MQLTKVIIFSANATYPHQELGSYSVE